LRDGGATWGPGSNFRFGLKAGRFESMDAVPGR
jgi:hypothetical protein